MSQVLIDGIENLHEVFKTCGLVEEVGHATKLAVEPAGARTHEVIIASQFAKYVLLQQGLKLKLCLELP